MARRILVGLAILTLSTSAALAAQRAHHYYGHHHYRHPMRAYARVAPPAGPVGPGPGWMGGIKQADYTTYLKNLHDSGYDPKNDYKNGIMRTN
jgi:hypothetical protein